MFRKIFQIFVAIMIVTTLSACDNVRAGFVGVKVDKYGDSRGVQNEVLGPGRYWTGPNTDIFEFPTYTVSDQYAGEQAIKFQSKEGTSVSADFGVTFSIKRENVAKVFEKYRRGVDEISDIYLRNMVRDSLNDVASMKSLDELVDKKVQFMKEVEDDVKKRAATSGITVEAINNIGEFRWPDQIKAAMNAKMTATQDAIKVENELRKTKAEAEKAVAKSEAEVRVAANEAKALELKGQAIAKNPGVLQQMAIERWDGKLPQVTGGSTPFVNIK